MKFKTLSGKERFLNVERYRVNWSGKSLSLFQKGIKDFLRSYWQHHIVYEELPVLGTRLRIDLYNATKRIAVECDGKQHGEYNKFFHAGNRENYLKQIQRDSQKYNWCKKNGILLINIEPHDLPLTKDFFEKLGIFL